MIHQGKVVQTEDEPTGGTHLSLVLAGNYHISFEEAETIKQDYSRHKEILPVVKAVVEKIASIIKRYVDPQEIDTFISAEVPAVLQELKYHTKGNRNPDSEAGRPISGHTCGNRGELSDS